VSNVDVVVEQEVVPDRDFVSEAQAQGWKPQEEFQGNPEQWVDAETFVKRGEQFVGILKSKYDSLEKRLRYQEQIAHDIKDLHKKQTEADRRKIEELAAALEKQRIEAINNADGESFVKIDKELEEIKESKRQLDVKATPPLDPFAQEWMQDNPWYGKDDDATAIAERYSARLHEAQPFLKGREFLDQVAAYVKTKMPQAFGNKQRSKEPEVEIGGRPPQTVGKSQPATKYNELPQDAKDAFNRFVQEKVFKNTPEDRARYAELYN
jgi:hypothetical protein